jgi:hypothetical protein
MPSEQIESALLLICHEADHAVAAERARFDRAAQDGIPAHFTVLYPFKPVDLMTAQDHRRLEQLAAASQVLSVRLSRSEWFGDSVLYLAPDDSAPIAALTRRIWSAFPDYPPYAGRFLDPVPHLTIGHDQPIHELKAAEHSVRQRLPLTQRLDHIELWAGPAVEGRTEPAPWHHVRDYQLGSLGWRV